MTAEAEKRKTKTTKLAAIIKVRRSFSEAIVMNLRQNISILFFTIVKYWSIITPPSYHYIIYILKSLPSRYLIDFLQGYVN
jgi:hypothetical protein